MDRDRMEGKGQEAIGGLKEQTGDLTNNEELESEGRVDQAEGRAQHAWGETKDTFRDAKDAVAEKVDR